MAGKFEEKKQRNKRVSVLTICPTLPIHQPYLLCMLGQSLRLVGVVLLRLLRLLRVLRSLVFRFLFGCNRGPYYRRCCHCWCCCRCRWCCRCQHSGSRINGINGSRGLLDGLRGGGLCLVRLLRLVRLLCLVYLVCLVHVSIGAQRCFTPPHAQCIVAVIVHRQTTCSRGGGFAGCFGLVVVLFQRNGQQQTFVPENQSNRKKT